MATRVVHVYKNGASYFAYPPVMVLRGGVDRVKIVNHTTEQIQWSVGHGPFSAVRAHSEMIAKDGGVSSSQKARRIRAAIPYKLLGAKSGKRAKGNSDPVVIIDM